MSQKYHVKPDGTVGVCKAERGRCPYQSAPHFNSEQEAQGYIDEQNEKEHGILPEVKSKKKTENMEIKINEILKTAGEQIDEIRETIRSLNHDRSKKFNSYVERQEDFLTSEMDKKYSLKMAVEILKYALEEVEKEMVEDGIELIDLNTDTKMKINAAERRLEDAKANRRANLKTIRTTENILEKERRKEEEKLLELKNREEFAKKAMSTQAQLTNNYKQGIFFDSSLYDNNNDEDSFRIKEDVRYFLEEYTNKPRGTVRAYALLAKRESPRDGRRAGSQWQWYNKIKSDKIENVVIHTIELGGDSFYLRDNNGVLEFVTTDHDGYNVYEVKPITKSRVEEYDRVTNSYTNVKYDANNVISFLEKIPSVTIKKSKRFNTED